jgi:hypothetical protein
LGSRSESHACATIRHNPASFDQEQGFDAAVRVHAVFSHLTGRKLHRDVAEDMDLGAQDAFLERAQSCRRQALHPRDEGRHRLALRRPGGRVERSVGVEIGGEHLLRGLLPGPPNRELPNCRAMSACPAATLGKSLSTDGLRSLPAARYAVSIGWW